MQLYPLLFQLDLPVLRKIEILHPAQLHKHNHPPISVGIMTVLGMMPKSANLKNYRSLYTWISSGTETCTATDNNSDIDSQTQGLVADLIKEALSHWERHDIEVITLLC